MKLFCVVTILVCSFVVSAQPKGNGNGNGNGGNGNNGNGNGGCGNPPCGGPNSVPIDVEWLVLIGLVAGCYIKFSKPRKA